MLKQIVTFALIGAFGLASCAASDPDEPSPNAQDDLFVTPSTPPQSFDERARVLTDAQRRGERPTFLFNGEMTQGGWIKGIVPFGAERVFLGEQEVEIADDGSFFAAFDRDAPKQVILRAEGSEAATFGMVVDVSPREWKISRVNVSRGRGKNLDAWWKKREPEYNAIKDARAKETGATGWKQDFIWPVKGRISGFFGRQRIYAGEPGPYHSGIDVAASTGTPLLAPADGVVVLARTGFSLEGGIIIVDHGAGLNSAFIHLSKLAVKEGQAVKQGQHIGNVGSSGRATGPHMHWSLKWGEARIDPLLMTGPMR